MMLSPADQYSIHVDRYININTRVESKNNDCE